jgi:hypothetical protein
MSESEDQKEFKKEIDDTFATINRDQGEYDRQLLTLSSGFLAVSLAFIKDVVPLKDAEFLPILYTAFILLGCCIMLVLFSYQFSISGHLKAKEYWDNRLTGNENAVFPLRHAKFVKWVNWIPGILFGLGVSLLVIFVILNLHHEAQMSNISTMGNSAVKDGAYMKTPPPGQKVEKGAHIKVPPQPTPQQAPSPNTGGSGGSGQTKKS